MFGLASISNFHSSSKSRPLRFGFCWNYSQFLSGSSTRWYHARWCDSMRGVVKLSYTYLNQAPNRPGQQWLVLLPHQIEIYILPPKVDPWYLACAEILVNSWEVLAHGDSMDGIVMLWEVLWKRCYTSTKPPTGLGNNGWPCFYVKFQFFLQKWAPHTIPLVLEIPVANFCEILLHSGTT